MLREATLWFGMLALTTGGPLLACASYDALPAEGAVLGQPVRTTVDSPAARDLLAHGVGSPEHQDWAEGVILPGLPPPQEQQALDAEGLRAISEAHSVDVATLYFAEWIRREPAHWPWQQAYLRNLERARAGALALPPQAARYKMLFVGGFHYKSDPNTGADMARPRALLRASGVPVALVETGEDGRVEDNAAIIAEAIRNEPSGNLILVSASKGGPEVAYALGMLLDAPQAQKVRAWVSIGGLLRGTYLADDAVQPHKWWLARLVLWVLDIDSEAVPGLTVAASTERHSRLSFPPHVLIVTFIGLSLSGQIGEGVRDRYAQLRPHGPNDGLTLLAHQLVDGGHAIVDLGSDHFFRDPSIDLKVLALASLTLDRLGP